MGSEAAAKPVLVTGATGYIGGPVPGPRAAAVATWDKACQGCNNLAGQIVVRPLGRP